MTYYNFFDQIFLAGVGMFLTDKQNKSRDLSKSIQASGKFPTAQLPTFLKPEDFNSRLAFIKSVADFISMNFRYMPDPDLFDHYTLPEVAHGISKKIWSEIKAKETAQKSALTPQQINEAFIQGFKSFGVCFDCDDTATMAALFFMTHAYPLKFEMANLLVADQFKHIRWNHVIFLAQLDGARWACIDTNGLNWFEATSRSELDLKTKQFFQSIYRDDKGINIEYKYLIPIKYPF